MIFHRDGSPRRDDASALPRSVPELGRSLQRERSLLGLTVPEVAARTGLPPVMLEALEAGTVDRLPDRVQTVKTLRGYADALGLSGERYAMLLIDLWPSYGGLAEPAVVAQGQPGEPVASAALAGAAVASAPFGTGETRAVPASGSGATDLGPLDRMPAEAVPADVAPVEAATAGLTTTAPGVRRIGGTSPMPDGTAQVPMVFADTGVTPAVPGVIHRGRGPSALTVVLVVVALALLVGVAGLVVDRVHRQWLRDIGVLSTSTPPPHPGTAAHHATVPPPPAMALVSHSSTSATFAVREPSFQVKVVTVGGPSWIQATASTHPTPIYTGVLGVGQSKSFDVTQSLNLQVGSSSARVFVADGAKTLGFYFPPSAPFTLVFHSVS